MEDVWDYDAWGPKEDHGVDKRTELEGFTVGDQVVCITDHEDDGVYIDEQGIVVGICSRKANMFGDPAREELVIAFDGMDPIGVSPEYVEKI